MLEQLLNHENMFDTGVVRATKDIFSINFNMKVCYVFSLESPHRGDTMSKHNIHNILLMRIHNIPFSLA